MRRNVFRRSSAVLLMAAWLSGCTTWRAQNVTPQQYITEQRPDRVQLMLSDSNVVQLEGPRILRDSVIGDQNVGNTNRRVAVPLGDVVAVRTGRVSIGKTMLAGLGIAGGVALMVVLAGNGQPGYPY